MRGISSFCFPLMFFFTAQLMTTILGRPVQFSEEFEYFSHFG